MNSYKVYDFDNSKIDFLELSNNFLKKSTDNKVDDIDQISKYFDKLEKSKVESIFYELFHSKIFNQYYQTFINDNLVPMFGNKFKYQAIPSIRVAFPDSQSVNFHNDCWYGHGEEIINIWIPLTNVRESQSLAFLDEDENQKALNYFYSEEPSLNEIQKYCLKKSHFAELNYGQFLVFPTKSLHGTVKNTSSKIRISFDFRICLDGDIGLKNNNFFLSLSKRKNQSFDKKINNIAIGYLNQNKISNEIVISQTIQQESIISYCKKNDLNLTKLETELIGFSKSINLENILFGDKNETAKNIIIFSEKNLDINNRNNFNMIEKGKQLGYTFHFVNEGTIWKK